MQFANRKTLIMPSVVTRWQVSGKSPGFFITNAAIDAQGRPSMASREDYQERFQQAVECGALDEVESLLRQFPGLLRKTSTLNSPAHLAMAARQMGVLHYLLHLTKDPNVTNSKGYTLLHAAVVENDLVAIKELLRFPELSVDSKLNTGDTALHLAVRYNHQEALKELVSSPRVNVDMEGCNGRTALHAAASVNHLECAKVLISHGASLTAQSDTGEQPVHSAAESGSTEVLSYILELPNCPVEQILSAQNEEEATPLHYGVNSGNRETVRTLLEHGAPIDAQMFEQSTPLHLACARGFTDMVELMHAFNVVEFDRVVRMKDAQEMTPMHRAAMFNYWDLLRLLVEKHATIDTRDSYGRTVLVLAASCGAWDAVSELLSLGADPFITSQSGQNFIHMAVSIGGDPGRFNEDFRKDSSAGFLALINGKDHDGMAPLHYAAQHGFGNCCESLIKLGATLTFKDKQSRTPLHYAAANGRYNTVKTLLSNAACSSVINDADTMGLTAIHLAAENGHVKIVQFLMSRAATMLRDFQGCLPLHLACATDQQEIVELIISAQPALLNAPEKDGNTPLHVAAQHGATKTLVYLLHANAQLTINAQNLTALDLAIMNKRKDAVSVMVDGDRWREIVTQPSSLHEWPILGLIEELPGVLLKVLDKCVTSATSGTLSKNYWVRYDFDLLEPECELKDPGGEQPEKPPLQVLNLMTAYKRTELLQHPVCTRYLDSKWHTYGVYFHFSSLLLYIAFVSVLTYLVLVGIEIDLRPHIRVLDTERIKANLPEYNSTRFGPIDLASVEGNNTEVDSWLLALAIICAVLNVGKKSFQLVKQKWGFFFRMMNWFELTLYITTIVFCSAFYDQEDYYLSWQSQWLVGATAIFFTWVNLFLHLQRYGEVGLHVIILLTVMRTLVEAMCVLFVIVLAFSMTFTVLNPMKILPDDEGFYQRDHDNEPLEDIHFTAYSTLQTSVLRVSDQMVGNADVITNFISPMLNKLMLFPVTTYILALLSMAIVTMLVQALINGLTLGDIRKVRDTLVLRRKAMQVDLHTEIEEKLPGWLLTKWRRKSELVYPNRLQSRFLKGVLRYLTNAHIKEDQGDETDGTLNKQNADWDNNAASIKTELTEQSVVTESLSAKMEQQQELLRLIVMQLGITLENDSIHGGETERKRKISRYVMQRQTK